MKKKRRGQSQGKRQI